MKEDITHSRGLRYKWNKITAKLKRPSSYSRQRTDLQSQPFENTPIADSQPCENIPALESQLYQYTPVDESNKEIRMLTLLPTNFSPDIRIRLTNVRLDDRLDNIRLDKRSPLLFEALSYTWGPPTNPKTILIETPTGWGRLSVTQNLAEALPFLRYEDEPRKLWIDAICINQQNLTERSTQVKRMADIYSTATNVVIWLGPESEDSALGIRCIEEMALTVSISWYKYTTSAMPEEFHRANRININKLRVGDHEIMAVLNFLNRDWFRRLWIWQESWLAKEADALCGSHCIPYEDIRRVMYMMYLTYDKSQLPQSVKALEEQHQHLRLLHDLCRQTKDVELVDLLDKTKGASCTDPRDRVFALMSLLPLAQRRSFPEPDYTKSSDKIYQDIMRWFTTRFRRLSLLTTVELSEHALVMPSWAPNWAVRRATGPLANGFASGNSESVTTFIEGGVMETTGVFASTVQASTPFNAEIDSMHGENMAKDLQRVLKEADVAEASIEATLDLYNLSMILTSGYISEAFAPPATNCCDFLTADAILRNILSKSNGGWNNHKGIVTDQQNLFLKTVNRHCSGRSLLKCLDGTLALGPRAAKPGDKVAVLLGCNSAMIMRPSGGSYQVVGEAYCEGTVDGAALLGPLPEGFRHIRRFSRHTDQYYDNFIHQPTGKFYAEDPRLKELPQGWIRERHDHDEFWSCFENEETGENNGVRDPRLTPENLKARGVKLERIELI